MLGQGLIPRDNEEHREALLEDLENGDFSSYNLFCSLRVVVLYEKFVGKDYAQHLDRTYEAVREMGLSTELKKGLKEFTFLQSISLSEDFSSVWLRLQRNPCPYGTDHDFFYPFGAWRLFEVKSSNPFMQKDSSLSLEFSQTFLDPNKTEDSKYGPGPSQDIIFRRKFQFKNAEELFACFRKSTLEALTSLSDFRGLAPPAVNVGERIRKMYHTWHLSQATNTWRCSVYDPLKDSRVPLPCELK